MRIVIATILAAATIALPSVATAKETVRELQARGCSVHQVHVPAGKIQINQPVVRCPAAAAEIAAKRNATVEGSARVAAAK